jgi:hypothetical protein
MDKELITQAAGELSEREPLELAGQVANRAAVARVFEEYLSRKARNTIRAQAAALDLFADYLDAAGDAGAIMRQFAAAVSAWRVDEGNGRPDPTVWRGVTWGIVEGLVKWLPDEGYAVTTVNNRLSVMKVYAFHFSVSPVCRAGKGPRNPHPRPSTKTRGITCRTPGRRWRPRWPTRSKGASSRTRSGATCCGG